MTMEYLGNLGSMVGGMAIFVSLLYLAVETRVNTKAIRSAAHHSANISFADSGLEMAGNTDLCELMWRVMAAPDADEFTDQEWFRFTQVANQNFWRYQDFYDQYRYGAIEEELWVRRRGFARALLENPAWSAWWQDMVGSSFFSSAFINEIDTAPLGDIPYLSSLRRKGSG